MTSTPPRRWLQFTTKDLLLGVTLIAVGAGGIASNGEIESAINYWYYSTWVVLQIYFGACACIGAGLFSPLRQKTLGAVLGFLWGTPAIVLVHAIIRARDPDWDEYMPANFPPTATLGWKLAAIYAGLVLATICAVWIFNRQRTIAAK